MARVVVVALVLAVAVAGCGSKKDGGSGSPAPTGEQANDTELVLGWQVYQSSCAECHGFGGKGGQGPQLAGQVEAAYPDIGGQVAVITNGRLAMPGFRARLTTEEIRAVARYEREVL